MLKEMKGMEYTLEVLRALHNNDTEEDEKCDSVQIYKLVVAGGRIEPSKSYIQKILPRMVKANLLASNEKGYELNKSIDEVTVDIVLDICDMPSEGSPLYSLCDGIKKGVSLSTIDEFYDFSATEK